MHKIMGMVMLGLYIAAGTSSAVAADAANGKKLSTRCTVCHGKLGVSNDPEVPSLAGQSAFYIEKTIVDYQTGKREDRRMTLMAKPLTMEEIRDLAAWYESLKVTVEEPAE